MNKLLLTLIIGTMMSTVGVVFAQNTGDGQVRMSGRDDLTPLTPAQISAQSTEIQPPKQYEVALEADNYALAESEARKMIGDPGDTGTAEPVLALALDAEGKDQEALKVFNHLYTGGEDEPGVLLPYALLLLKHGQWAQAVDVYHKALPHVGGGGLPLGDRLLAEENDYSADDPEPTDLETDVHIALGMNGVYANGVDGHYNNFKDMVEIKKALTLEPDSPLANLAYAGALVQTGQRADSIAAFQAVASKYSGDVKVSADEELGIFPPATPAPNPPTGN